MVLTNYEFSALLGGVYKGGGMLFTSEGERLLSPTGNRLSVFDLERQEMSTLPFQNRRDISCLALCPRDVLLVSIDQDGYAVIFNLKRNIALHYFRFGSDVLQARFSEDGRFLAVLMRDKLEIWKAPSLEKEVSPMEKHCEYPLSSPGAQLCWSSDSSSIAVATVSGFVKVFGFSGDVEVPVRKSIYTLHGHKRRIVFVGIVNDNRNIISISEDGVLCIWERDAEDVDRDFRWNLLKKLFFQPSTDQNESGLGDKTLFSQRGRRFDATCADYHSGSGKLSVGFRNGIFAIYDISFSISEVDDVETEIIIKLVQSFSVTQSEIDSSAFNSSGEWISFGSKRWGQLIIWEWKSETYILKQQGHEHGVNAIDFSPNGEYMVSGGDDGKVKVWNIDTGLCFVTFSDHMAPVTEVCFMPSGRGFLSSSLDGTVNAYDLVRNRNFRTFTSNLGAQFNCVAIHSSGDVLAAGGSDGRIHVWEVRTGKILDSLSGHEGPISCLRFHPQQGILFSGSWDGNVRSWSLFTSNVATETFDHEGDVVALDISPDGSELCVSTLNGQVFFWDIQEVNIKGTIDGSVDIVKGAYVGQKTSNLKYHSDKFFSTICYSSDGNFLLAGGRSKYIYVYHSKQRILLKRHKISDNILLDGVLDIFHSKKDPSNDLRSKNDEFNRENWLPGVKSGDLSDRNHKLEVISSCVKFSPTNENWASSTSTGILLYSLNKDSVFDPIDVSTDLTPETTKKALIEGRYQVALVMSLKLNDHELIKKIVHGIPFDEYTSVICGFPVPYVKRLLIFIASELRSSTRMEHFLTLLKSVFVHHGNYIENHGKDFNSTLISLRKSLNRRFEELSELFFENTYTLDFVVSSKL